MTITVTAVAELAAQPRVLVDVVTTGSGPQAVAGDDVLAVYRVHADGSRWKLITATPWVTAGRAWFTYDYHAPFNQAISYVAVVGGIESPPSATDYLLCNDTWLISHDQPALSVRVTAIEKIADRTRASGSGGYDIWQASHYLEQSGGVRKKKASSLRVLIPVNKVAAIDALFDGDGPVLINPGPRHADTPWTWVQPKDISESTPGDRPKAGYRSIEFPWRPIGQPDVDLSPPWNCDLANAEWLTCDAVNAAYPDARAFNLDIR